MKKPTIELVTVEAASIRVDMREITSAAATQSRVLADIGEATRDAVFEFRWDGDADELQACATRLRSAVAHGLIALTEIAVQAGRLEQLASVRHAAIDRD